MAANEHPNRRWPRLESKMHRRARAPSALFGAAPESLRWYPARSVTQRARRLRSPESTCCVQERSVSAQEFRCRHSPFSFKLHYGERKCAFASANDQIFVAAQNFSGLNSKVDN